MLREELSRCRQISLIVMVCLPAFLFIQPNFTLGSEGANNQTAQISVPAEEVPKMDCNYGTADFGFKAVKGEVNESVTQVIGSNGGCLQVTLSDGTVYILVVQPGGLGEDTEITMVPDLSSQNRTPEGHPDSISFSLDLKPEKLKFDIYAPALLKVHYTDSFIEALASRSNMTPQETEGSFRIYTFSPDPLVVGEYIYDPLLIFGIRDVRNNILVLEIKEFPKSLSGK